jgi:hypothetical protein
MRPRLNLIVQITAITIGCLLWAGCAGYNYYRKSPEGKVERVSAFTLFKKMDAELIQSRTVESTNGFLREVGVANIKTSGDAETIGSTGAAVGEAGATFIKKGLLPTP